MALHDGIAAALKGHRQSDVAERLGVNQNSVSRWKTGKALPDWDQIAALEDVCGRPRGFVMIHAGYLSATCTVAEALGLDAALDDTGREAVLSVYHHFAANPHVDQDPDGAQ